jgi:hypothetical protein
VYVCRDTLRGQGVLAGPVFRCPGSLMSLHVPSSLMHVVVGGRNSLSIPRLGQKNHDRRCWWTSNPFRSESVRVCVCVCVCVCVAGWGVIGTIFNKHKPPTALAAQCRSRSYPIILANKSVSEAPWSHVAQLVEHRACNARVVKFPRGTSRKKTECMHSLL